MVFILSELLLYAVWLCYIQQAKACTYSINMLVFVCCVCVCEERWGANGELTSHEF